MSGDKVRPVSASKRRRCLGSKANAVVRQLAGATIGPVRWVDCHATSRRDQRAAMLTGCRERLAEIRYEPADVIAFEVLAPVRYDGDVIVLAEPAKAGHPAAVIRPLGTTATFRCPRCGNDTRVNLTQLARVRPGSDSV